MLINLLLQLLAVAPHAISEVQAAMAEVRSKDPNGTKATTIAQNVSAIAATLGSAVSAADKS